MWARQYTGAADLSRLQQFNAEKIFQNPVGWLQPGDIPHRLYNGLRHHDPAPLLRLWEDDDGEGDTLLGWALVYPTDSFDIQADREDVISEALTWVESQLTTETIETDLWNADDPRRAVLVRSGFSEAPDEPLYFITNRSLSDPIPEVVLPHGFSIRATTGIDEAGKLAEVHAESFDSDWTAESYARLMQSPGYAAEREFVVVAPDTRFAAFTVTWHDWRNKTGYFEPVGTHKDFRRLGLARALLFHAMRTMRAAGLETAIVAHESPEENPVSAALYQALGFQVRYTTSLYRKTRQSE